MYLCMFMYVCSLKTQAKGTVKLRFAFPPLVGSPDRAVPLRFMNSS